jgi:hypothetical protein
MHSVQYLTFYTRSTGALEGCEDTKKYKIRKKAEPKFYPQDTKKIALRNRVSLSTKVVCCMVSSCFFALFVPSW